MSTILFVYAFNDECLPKICLRANWRRHEKYVKKTAYVLLQHFLSSYLPWGNVTAVPPASFNLNLG